MCFSKYEMKSSKAEVYFQFCSDEASSYATLPGSYSFCYSIWSHLLTVIGPSIHLSQHLVKQTIRSAEREPSLREAKVSKCFFQFPPDLYLDLCVLHRATRHHGQYPILTRLL